MLIKAERRNITGKCDLACLGLELFNDQRLRERYSVKAEIAEYSGFGIPCRECLISWSSCLVCILRKFK